LSLAQPVYGLAVSAGYQMPVNVDGHLDAAMAHLFFYVGGALTVRE
jgi:hypothetical protein